MAYSLHSGINATFFVADDYGWVEPSIYDQIANDFFWLMPRVFFPGVDDAASSSVKRHAYSEHWGAWMYFERRTTAPITFELYHNATVDEPGLFNVIEDNSTHYIVEWLDIYGIWAPVESAIERTWEVVMPGFDYLLENTPIFTAAYPSVSGGINESDSVTVGVRLTCQSVLFDSTDPIYGFLEYDSSSMSTFSISTSIIDAGATEVLSTSFDLPTDLGDSPVSLYIGNNFTGYVHLRLSLGEAPPVDIMLFVAIGGVVLVAIVIVIVRKKT